jgi:procollagen-lysine,2-oxoglutarate 5-dioxygenase
VEKGQRFLNSALFIGYASDLYKILNEASAENIEDEQLFFTKTFLDEKKREQFKIKLDQRMQLFQNLKWSDNNDVFLISLSGMLFKRFTFSS